MLESFSFDKNFIISVCAIIISIISVVIGVYYNWRNLKMTIEHNKKSVMPLITSSLEFTTEKGNLLILKNLGLGPAIINSVCFSYNQKSYNSLIEVFGSEENIWILKLMDVKLSQTTTLTQESIVGSGDEVLLHKLLFISKINSEKFLKLLERISIEVKYSNIYNDSKVFVEPLMFERN